MWRSDAGRNQSLPSRSAREMIRRSSNPTCSKRQAMTAAKFHQIWIEQCEAARGIRERYGIEAAFDYAFGEKLMNFASAARSQPAFARELPRFISEVRRMFSVDEIRAHLARLEREEKTEEDADVRDPNDDEFEEFPGESPAEA